MTLSTYQINNAKKINNNDFVKFEVENIDFVQFIILFQILYIIPDVCILQRILFFLYQKHSLFFQFYYNDNKNHIEQLIQGLGNLRI